MLIDVRRFRINTDPSAVVEIGLSARLVDKSGKVVASQLFDENQPLGRLDPADAVAAFDQAFGRVAKSILTWTVQAL